ncbi:NAD(P)-dependent alcohol dehydrogenase [Nonomuraea angiospora]|uniref:alcohol dehydrogenase n=1 Tax=Nonomuraea angiospora TaxID=46172 RepID=A0ABR9LYJ2_9ACTN|nr:NAD(P)-dependent alcohol dehydrogenase [Nonomuraea angiospora]MBE1585402.1 propanol-preferring alcohol dehydrogenase [Nonomuraea angiospora]
MTMRAARMHGYKQPLRIDEVPVPEPGPGEVLIKVAATGMCRSDYQLIDGYFPSKLVFPYIPGHEVAGHVAQVGAGVPASAGLSEGDLVVVDPAWGDGTCRQCHEGNEQLCTGSGGWIGFGPPGGFAEYVTAPSRHLVRIDPDLDLQPQYLAPLVDAGLTPYRGMKKLQAAGRLGGGRTVIVSGIGGLGGYGVQYARLLGGGATVVAFARSDDKLAVARENGADHTVNTRGKTSDQVRAELTELTGRGEADAVLDCSGAPESLALNASLLAYEGALVSVGLMGQSAEMPLFPFVSGERTFSGSFWGNYNDLTEVLALAGQGRIKHTVTPVKLDDINDRLDALARGDVIGRQVVVFD